MKLGKISLLCVAIAAAPFVNADRTRIIGHVAHGVNTYNGGVIADFSEVAPLAGILADPSIEVGYFIEGASASGVITPETSRSELIATTTDFIDFFNPNNNVDPALVNQPIGAIGSNAFTFNSVLDRAVPDSFPEQAFERPVPYRVNDANEFPTVADWETASGLMTIDSHDDGTSTVRVTIRNGFPEAVYTFWDLGQYDPLTADESVYVVPLGGIPNAAISDENGCVTKEFDVAYDLARACEVGATSCSNLIAGFYHWDGQLYGAAPTGNFADVPTGIVGSIHMFFNITGTNLQEPATQFKRPRIHGCFNPKRKFFKKY
ncbi:hypothetical protein [Sessilibacter corallicola]|uniref:Uncharacterized protein n=1 Tax=Sessilibacter corallicola TaxID=2904075 RepID=A0ABQ0AE75_9GAMM|nr:hypothetical protein [Sessilibacter corallicola]MCE2028331.1 hypothetical protein [Sessilibacter corallicola]